MSWETTGTVTVTNNSATVTGSGTLFTVKSRVGDAFIGPDGALYEIVNIVSNTVLSISPTYKGVTGSAKAYKIAPVRGYQKLSADRLYTIVNTIGDAVEVVTDLPAWLKAKQPTPVSAGGTGAETQLAARQNLGLKGAAVLDIGTTAGTVAAGDDARLADSREWIADTIPQAEAEAGTATTRRAFTAQSVRQAVVAWFNGISGALGRTILTRTTAAQIQSDIGLGTAATRNVGTATGNLLEASSNYFGVQSGSDFPNGTLIRTSFPSLDTGPSITLKVRGKGYNGSLPHLIMVEAYQYGGAWVSVSGINLSGNITNVTVMELDGYVCFWFASTGYWNSFFVEAYDTSGQSSTASRVTSVENSTKPSGAKVVDIPLAMTYNTSNLDAPSKTGSGASGTWGINVTGNAATATKLSTDRSNFIGSTDSSVVGELMWKAYGNGHTIFDASNSTAPTGVATNNIDPDSPWGPASPTLMGYNGSATFGVRVDSSRYADQLKTARTIWLGGDLTGSVSIDGSTDVTLTAQVNDDSHNHTKLHGTVGFTGSTGNAYNNSNIVIEGNGATNTIKPSIGFHQPTLYGGSLSMVDANTFQFQNINGAPAFLANPCTPTAHTHPASEITGLGTAATRNVGAAAGDVMDSQDVRIFGGANSGLTNPDYVASNSITYSTGTSATGLFHDGAIYAQYYLPGEYGHQIFGDYRTGSLAVRGLTASVWTPWRKVIDSGNTTLNPDGTFKASSPVINLYTDNHELHNESQFGATPTVIRKSKGVYEITGTLGLRSEGWYLDTPSDRNGNKYFNIEWTQNITPDAVDSVVDEYRDDIVVTIETFERVWNKDTGLFENGAPIDINDSQARFVQLRFNELKVEHEEMDDDDSN